MKITEVEIVPVKPDAGLIAFVTCVVDDALYLGSIAVFTKLSGGYRLVFPTKKIGERNFHYHHPINRAATEDLERAILPRVAELFDYQTTP
jgi:DNA-binding cell septation regulator SpoVG